jgi:zinc finger BED domain-containing protein 1 (E3 SUMO-protein ligase ZBED1)
MVKRIHEQVAPINAILSKAKKFNLVLNDNEIRVIREAIPLLMPLSQATDLLSASSYPTAGLSMPVYHKLPQLLADLVSDCNVTKSVRHVLRKGVEIYDDKFSLNNNDFLITAAYLHPRYKMFNNMEKALQLRTIAENVILTVVTAINPDISNSDPKQNGRAGKNGEPCLFSDTAPSTQCDMYRSLEEAVRSELTCYLADSIIDTPLKYWSYNRIRFPILAFISRIFICIPATSVPSECLFSHAGYAIWERRSKLKPERVDRMLFLYDNKPPLIQQD